jgi:CP family cyanate transporter-like MFS transporter
MTFLMGVGIAVSQPSLPSLVRQWLPDRAALATAVYSNGLLVGEIVAAAFTAPLLLHLLGGHWQAALAFWSAPIVLTALATLLLTPHASRAGTAPARWWPDWHSRRTWSLGLVLGCASLAYFCANAFVPDYLRATHHGDLVTATLTSLNLGQLPTSLVVALLSWRVIGRRWPIILAGLLIIVMPLAFGLYEPWIVLWAGGLGFATALIFVLSLALPPILAEEGDVHRLSAAMFTISYACPLIGSIIGGAVWDATGVAFTPFLPIMLAGAVMISLVLTLHIPLPVLDMGQSDAALPAGVPPKAAR